MNLVHLVFVTEEPLWTDSSEKEDKLELMCTYCPSLNNDLINVWNTEALPDRIILVKFGGEQHASPVLQIQQSVAVWLVDTLSN